MKLSPQSIEQLNQCLKNCDVILTPNKRLAQQLLPLVKNTLKASSISEAAIAELPEILPFDQWVSNCYRNALLTGQVDPLMVITTQEEQVLWQQVLNEYAEQENTAIVPSIVSEVQKAHSLLRDYRIDLSGNNFLFESLPDARIFKRWLKALESKLAGKGLITQVQAGSALTGTTPVSRPLKIALLGFEKLTPLQYALLSHFSDASKQDETNILKLDLRCDTRQFLLGAVEDSDRELELAAHWAKRWQQKDPSARIAVIVADLGQNRLKAQRIFQQVFAPGESLESSVGQFNISMGCPLKSTEPVSVALGVLGSFLHRIPLAEWNVILTSRYLAFGRDYRQLGDRLLRAMYASGEAEFAFTELTALHDWYPGSNDPELSDNLKEGIDVLLRLNQVVRESRKAQARASISIWAEKFYDVLETLGWPQTGKLGSIEYQQYQGFTALIDSLARYDRVIGEVSLSAALGILSQLAQSTIFQPESAHGDQGQTVPQVLGMLEALGQNFDAVWLTGMSDQQWPQAINPNAFIPLQIQIAYGMPSSSVEAELDYAKGIARRLLCCASEELVISYPATIDEAGTRCSPVVLECILNPGDSSTGSRLAIESMRQHFDAMVAGLTNATKPSTPDMPQTLELIDDCYGTQWCLGPGDKEGHKPYLPGGASTLRDIANNPPAAYARQRLRIEAVYSPTGGIRPLEKGNIVHRALDLFWKEVRESRSLQSLDNPSRKLLVRKHIEQAMQGVFVARYRQPEPDFIAIELEALTELLLAWLTVEARRPAFSVCATEHSVDIELAQCRIRGRIDRIECLDSQRLLLADYKTGTLLPPKWQYEPLYEPQLPLYMLALEEQVSSGSFTVEHLSSTGIAGIYLAGVKPGYIKCIGLTDDTDVSESVAGFSLLEEGESWPRLQLGWRKQIEGLTEKALRGYAGYDPEIHEPGNRYESFVRSRFVYYLDN